MERLHLLHLGCLKAKGSELLKYSCHHREPSAAVAAVALWLAEVPQKSH